jgi:hypothetical protein
MLDISAGRPFPRGVGRCGRAAEQAGALMGGAHPDLARSASSATAAMVAAAEVLEEHLEHVLEEHAVELATEQRRFLDVADETAAVSQRRARPRDAASLPRIHRAHRCDEGRSVKRSQRRR